jgi:hypothetical protein
LGKCVSLEADDKTELYTWLSSLWTFGDFTLLLLAIHKTIPYIISLKSISADFVDYKYNDVIGWQLARL